MLIIKNPNQSPRPNVSGKWSAILLTICFALSAVLIPVAAHLSPWIEFQLVLGVWWSVWTLVLTWMLFNASVIDNDANPPKSARDTRFARLKDSFDWFDLGCLFGFEGCAAVGFVLVLIGGLFFFIELFIPFVAFLAYLAIKGMLARVTN